MLHGCALSSVATDFHGAKAPGHQYRQCWLNVDYIGLVSPENITQLQWTALANKIAFWKQKWSNCSRVKFEKKNYDLDPCRIRDFPVGGLSYQQNGCAIIETEKPSVRFLVDTTVPCKHVLKYQNRAGIGPRQQHRSDTGPVMAHYGMLTGNHTKGNKVRHQSVMISRTTLMFKFRYNTVNLFTLLAIDTRRNHHAGRDIVYCMSIANSKSSLSFNFIPPSCYVMPWQRELTVVTAACCVVVLL